MTSYLRLRQELTEKSNDVMQMTKINERLQLENQELSHELERENKKKYQLLQKFKCLRVNKQKEKRCSHVALNTNWIRPVMKYIFVLLFLLTLNIILNFTE